MLACLLFSMALCASLPLHAASVKLEPPARTADDLNTDSTDLKERNAGAVPNIDPARVRRAQFIDPDPATGTSKAVVVEDQPLIHTSQFLPLSMSGALVGNGDATPQAEQVLDNLAEALKSARAGLNEIIKLNVCIADAAILPQVQRVLARRFSGTTKPAVTYVGGRLPRDGALVAMDAVAIAPLNNNSRSISLLRNAALPGNKSIAHAAVLPAGPRVYVSGMADSNPLPLATRKTMEKLADALSHLGLAPADIVQVKAFVQPMAEVARVEEEIVRFFGDATVPPLVFVEWLSANPPVEIELIAAAKGGFSEESASVSYINPPGAAASKVYSRVARVNRGRMIYISGLYGASDSAAGQIHEMFAAMNELLRRTGSDLEHLAKATYYVLDNDANNKLNELRPQFYNPQRPPAASKARVSSVAVPGRTVSMDMIAVTR
jgi:enamine deaminase RidA (YjgF/YER057c/UK114 family)